MSHSMKHTFNIITALLLLAPLAAPQAAGTEVKLVESKPESAARIEQMEQVAEHALVPPSVNTSPLPQYDYDKLDYGMTIGIERSRQGRLWACWVAGGDCPKAFFVLASSDDDGETWSKPRLMLDSHSPDLPTDRSILVGNLWTHPLGRLLLVKHGDKVDAHEGRVQLSAWLSDDDGMTWSGGLILDERKGISYPDGFQAPDGTIYISYDRNRATDGEILLARFTEADVLAKQLVAPKSKLKMLISRPLGIKQKSGGK